MVVSKYSQRRDYFYKLIHSGQKYLYFDEKRFYESIAMLNTFTTVIQVPNEYEAFRVMRVQAKKCIDNKHVLKNLKGKSNNPALNWLLSIKHLDKITSELIVDTLDLYSLNDLINLNKTDLLSIDGVEDTLADMIMKSINND